MNSKKKFMFREYNSTHGIIMVITDIEIIGKKFEDEKLQLDFSKNFYQGEEKTEQDIVERLKKGYIVNLNGTNSINIGLKLNLISKEKIVTVNQIPHAQAYLG